jgi:hypothetical protein
MENENKVSHSGGKTALVILLIICSSFILYYSVMSMLGPSRKLDELKHELSSESSGKKKAEEKTYADSAYLSLLKDRAFLQSKILMASTDSIYLTINLADSSINLEISGVVVHSAKINSFKASRFLTTGNENIMYSLLSTPLSILSEKATIRKEPVMIKMAPKDTSEYIPDIIPDTSITEPVSYILGMTHGISIYICQEEADKRSDRIALLRFDLYDRLRQTWKAFKRVAVLKVPEYHPSIKVKLPRSDAKIIYRAIPKNGQIALFL